MHIAMDLRDRAGVGMWHERKAWRFGPCVHKPEDVRIWWIRRHGYHQAITFVRSIGVATDTCHPKKVEPPGASCGAQTVKQLSSTSVGSLQ